MDDAQGERESPGEVELAVDPGTPLGAAIVRAVSRARGVPVDEVDVELNDYVDPDALEDVFAPRLDGTPREGGEVTFSVLDRRVRVTADRRVVVTRD